MSAEELVATDKSQTTFALPIVKTLLPQTFRLNSTYLNMSRYTDNQATHHSVIIQTHTQTDTREVVDYTQFALPRRAWKSRERIATMAFVKAS